MRLVLNENVSATVIAELRQRGHNVLSVKESMCSAADDAILARAAESRDVEIPDGGVPILRLVDLDQWCLRGSWRWRRPWRTD